MRANATKAHGERWANRGAPIKLERMKSPAELLNTDDQQTVAAITAYLEARLADYETGWLTVDMLDADLNGDGSPIAERLWLAAMHEAATAGWQTRRVGNVLRIRPQEI